MTAINFPNNPQVNDTFTAGLRTWSWDGTAWRIQSVSVGPTGPTGATGETGLTGTSGVISVESPIINTGNSSNAILGLNQSAISITQSQVANLSSDLSSKASSHSPSITGTAHVADLVIDGTLTFSGNATTINSTNLNVTDSLIYLASEQYDSDAVDIGIYGAYGDSNPGHLHTGLIRDASDSKWKLVSGGAEPSGNIIDFTSITYDTLKVGTIEADFASFGNVSATEIAYLDGVTSSIQSQLDSKSNVSHNHTFSSLTGTGIVSPSYGDVLSYDSASELWKNKTALDAGLTPRISYETTAMSATTKTLTINSPRTQYFTGSVNQAVALSVSAAVPTGEKFVFINKSTTNSLTLASYFSGTPTVLPGQIMQATHLGSGSWSYEYLGSATGYTGSGSLVYATAPSINNLQATGTVSLSSTTSIGPVSSTEIGYLDGVTSSIQAQLDAVTGSIVSPFLLIGA